jgi:hypothetical protein
MKTVNWEVCKGCECLDITEKNKPCSAAITPSVNNFSCPCINCLLKMFCNSRCNEFDKYLDNF